MKTGRIDNETLRNLCIRNRWFEEGTCEQYEKLFQLNAAGCSITEMALVIWLCSDKDMYSRQDILLTLDANGFKERAYISEEEKLDSLLGI